MPLPDGSITVLVVDDHPVVRTGLRALLGTLAGVAVVGEAADGAAAVREAVLLRPDVVLMDLRMPGIDGLTATRQLRTAVPATAVLVMTMSDDPATVRAAVQAGAAGYLLKNAGQDEVLGAVRAVAAGQAVFGAAVAGQVLGVLAGPTAVPVPFPELTDRERAVLDLLAAGLRTAAIAEALFLSPKTVSNHLTSIFATLQVGDRAAAIVLARDAGLGRGGR